jgi:hypothetical protein
LRKSPPQDGGLVGYVLGKLKLDFNTASGPQHHAGQDRRRWLALLLREVGAE